MAVITYDVSNVPDPDDLDDDLPFPLHDPYASGMKAPPGKQRKRKELAPEHERFRLYTVDELGQFPPVRWLIPGYLAVGELTCLYGAGATYKSFLALDWSCRLAAAGHTVVYIVAEGASGMRARIAAWMKHNGVEDLPSLRLMPASMKVHEHGQVGAWIEAMRAQTDGTPTLVVVDTLARNFVGGSENDSKDMGQFVEGAELIRRKLETAVLVIHHTTKDGTSERGGESLRNASFAMFKLKRVNQTRAVDVACDRMKDAPEPGAVRLAPVVVDLPELAEPGKEVSSLVAGWPSSAGSESTAERVKPAEFSAGQKRMYRVLNRSSYRSSGATSKQLRDALEIGSSALAERLRIPVEEGDIRREGSTSDVRYFLTEQGRVRVARSSAGSRPNSTGKGA